MSTKKLNHLQVLMTKRILTAKNGTSLVPMKTVASSAKFIREYEQINNSRNFQKKIKNEQIKSQ